MHQSLTYSEADELFYNSNYLFYGWPRTYEEAAKMRLNGQISAQHFALIESLFSEDTRSISNESSGS